MTLQASAATALFQTKIKVECRPIFALDWKAIGAIEAGYDYGVTMSTAKRLARNRAFAAFVATFEDAVVGWCIWKRMEGAIRIVRIVVAERWRRCGVATQIVDNVKVRLNDEEPQMEALVRETNDPAVAFFVAAGFQATGVVPEACEDESLDDYRFVYRRTP